MWHRGPLHELIGSGGARPWSATTAYRPRTGRLPSGRGPVQSPPMPTRTPEERAASRAETRRRARLAARGELIAEEEEVAADLEPGRERGGLFSRLFPAAPPLPNRVDPLAKFDRSGPLRPLRERIYLLRRNPLAWMLPSLACFVGYYLSETNRGNTLGLVGMFLTFGSLIAAGWFGWQRPALFGTLTALIAFVMVWGIFLATIAERAGDPTLGSPLELASLLLLQAVIQGGLGFLGGWYGGYLRRRQAQVSADARRASAGRRRG